MHETWNCTLISLLLSHGSYGGDTEKYHAASAPSSPVHAIALLRTRREWPRCRAAEQRDERASPHCPMPPVLPTERIAHLGTAAAERDDRGTPPIISSKEVAQNRPPHFLARTSLSTRNRFRPNFRGWRLDEFSIFARPPHPGSPSGPDERHSLRWMLADHLFA